MVKEKLDEFHKMCGEILRSALSIETTLDFFISNYFCSPQSRKTFFLSDLIIVGMNFDRKIGIFKSICKEEKVDKKELKRILDSINFVREIRNKVAHSELLIEDQKLGDPTLWSRKSIRYRKDSIKLTRKLVEAIEEKRLIAVKGIVKIHLELSRQKEEEKVRMTSEF